MLGDLNDLLALYVRESDPAPATVKHCENVMALFQRETQCTQVGEVTHELLLQWKALLKSRAAEATVNSYLRALRTLFNLADKRGLLETNPFQHVSYVPEYTRLKHTAEHVDILSLLGMIRQYPDENRPSWFWEAVLKTLYYTGMRRRQLVAMTWADVDFRHERILLRAEGSKTRREWHIPMTAEVVQALRVVKDKTLGKLEVGQVAAIRQLQVFNITLFNPDYAGKQMIPEQVTGYFKRVSLRYKVKISPHRFRHTFATQAANRGGQNLRHLQRMLGHTSLKTTLGYVESDTESMREMINGGIHGL